MDYGLLTCKVDLWLQIGVVFVLMSAFQLLMYALFKTSHHWKASSQSCKGLTMPLLHPTFSVVALFVQDKHQPAYARLIPAQQTETTMVVLGRHHHQRKYKTGNLQLNLLKVVFNYFCEVKILETCSVILRAGEKFYDLFFIWSS